LFEKSAVRRELDEEIKNSSLGTMAAEEKGAGQGMSPARERFAPGCGWSGESRGTKEVVRYAGWESFVEAIGGRI